MEVFFTPQQMLWVREHATLLGCLTVLAGAIALAAILRAVERRHPGALDFDFDDVAL